MQYVTSKDFDPRQEAEEGLVRAMRELEEAYRNIRCNSNLFDKPYPVEMMDLQMLIGYIDNFKLSEE